MTRRQLRLTAAPLLALLYICAGLAPALAADPPDFSGNWVLNTQKGQNLGMVAAVKESVTIAQTPQSMTLDYVTVFMGKATPRKTVYDLAGKPVQNEGPMGDKADTVARWSGNKLLVVWSGESAIMGTRSEKTEARALSADGNTMSVASVRGTKPPMVMVYERQK